MGAQLAHGARLEAAAPALNERTRRLNERTQR